MAGDSDMIYDVKELSSYFNRYHYIGVHAFKGTSKIVEREEGEEIEDRSLSRFDDE